LQYVVASGEARVSKPKSASGGPCSLSALSAIGETKVFYNAKSQASGEVKVF